jgi:pSer/pThr/pTyr-binding forkhead associated (FHA) protein
MTTRHIVENPGDVLNPLAPALKTISFETKDLGLQEKLLTGNALLQNQNTVIFTLIGTETNLTLQLADRIIIGRKDFDPENKVDLDLMPYGAREKGVSRRHAALCRSYRTLSLIDLKSGNGTYLNGVRLVADQPRLLRDGDEICFGHMLFHIHFAG